MTQYDPIATAYRDSKQLPFREFIERYTLFQLLQDIRGANVLDLACGDGFYTRLLKRAGASQVTGIDISKEMIRLAEQEERRNPLGCTYLHLDAASFAPPEPVDLVVATYLLNYARTRDQLLRFCRVCHDALRPGGRFAGVNDNLRNPPSESVSLQKYGLRKSCPPVPKEGDVILYTITNQDGRQFEFENYYLEPRTYERAFREAGFRDFRWVELSLHPSQQGNPYWDDFLASPPITAFAASRPE